MALINEKYNELLLAITQMLAQKSEEIESLRSEIEDLKKQIEDAEKEGI